MKKIVFIDPDKDTLANQYNATVTIPADKTSGYLEFKRSGSSVYFAAKMTFTLPDGAIPLSVQYPCTNGNTSDRLSASAYAGFGVANIQSVDANKVTVVVYKSVETTNPTYGTTVPIGYQSYSTFGDYTIDSLTYYIKLMAMVEE